MWTTAHALTLISLLSTSMSPSGTPSNRAEARPALHLVASAPDAPTVTGHLRRRLRKMTSTRVTPYLDFGGAASLIDAQQIRRPQSPDIPVATAPVGPMFVSPGVRVRVGALSVAAFVGLTVAPTIQTNLLLGLEVR
jgi:hypothetical protein